MKLETANFEKGNEVEEVTNPSETFESEKVLSHERSLLERFKGKTKNIANVMMLVSTLAGPGFIENAYGQEKGQTKTEQSEVLKINEANVTESGKWARDMVQHARQDISKLKTPEDADWFIRSNVYKFFNEWHHPSKGNIKNEQVYNLTLSERVSTDDDLELVLESAHEMKTILDEVSSKFHIMNAYANDELEGMIKSYEKQNSYADKKEREALDNAIKYFGK